jgi:hypothetical protein
VEEEEEEEEVLLSTLTLGSSSRLRFPSPSIVDDVVGSCCSGEGQRSKSRMTLNWVENKRLEQCDNRDDSVNPETNGAATTYHA